jgi:hypothetical protein
MRRTLILAMAAGATLSVAMPMQLMAQGRSAEAHARKNSSPNGAGRERQRDAVPEAREREAERLRQQREAQARVAAELRQQREAQARVAAELRQRELEREAQARAAAERRRWELEREAQARAAELRRRELERVRRERDGYYDDDRYERRDDRYGYYDRFPDHRESNKGPAFCRSGAGHPVHGRQWCVQKGFGLGWNRWERDRYADVIFRDRTYRRNTTLGRSTLGDILGSVVLGRFESFGRRYGSGSMNGYWLPETGANILQLNIGSIPFARLIDFNRDGRVDDVFVIS